MYTAKRFTSLEAECGRRFPCDTGKRRLEASNGLLKHEATIPCQPLLFSREEAAAGVGRFLRFVLREARGNTQNSARATEDAHSGNVRTVPLNAQSEEKEFYNSRSS